MIKDYLKQVQNEACLWHLLADISEIMTERQYKHKGAGITEADNFWLSAAAEVKEEIDRRLFINYENDNYNSDPVENEDDFENEDFEE